MNSHSVTFSRDNLIQLVLRPDFYEKNPNLLIVKDDLTKGIAAFRESGRKAGCGCRADARLLFDCFGKLLAELDRMKENSQEDINKFVLYATKIPIKNPTDRINLSIFFRKSSEQDDVFRHEYTYK